MRTQNELSVAAGSPRHTFNVGREDKMHPDSQMPNDEQRKLLCDMLHHALVEIRLMAAAGRCEQASDLADAFHNLPHEMWQDYFSISFFREAFLNPYYRKWKIPPVYDYLGALAHVAELKGQT